MPRSGGARRTPSRVVVGVLDAATIAVVVAWIAVACYAVAYLVSH